MSYSATINFKTVKEGELYAFFKKIKDTCKEKFDDIAEDNFIYMPSIHFANKRTLEGASDRAKEDADRAWMRNSVFSYRFFYLPEHNLLGIFGAPDAVKDIFDLTVYFQNSCDQDYEFDEWKGIPIFEQIAEKWKNATDEMVKVHYVEKWGEYDEEDFDCDYYRRDFAYDDIWRMFEDYLYKDELCVYLSIFGGYEHYHLSVIVRKCKNYYEEWKNRVQEKE